MKTLYIVRHAKADKSMLGLADVDRPLKRRGYTDAHNMGKLLALKKDKPEVMISSPGIRALSTALIFADELSFPKAEIRLEPKLYESSMNDYLEVIKNLPAGVNSLAIFGHNEFISELCSHFSGNKVEMPTCAIAICKFKTDEWNLVSRATMESFEIHAPEKNEGPEGF